LPCSDHGFSLGTGLEKVLSGHPRVDFPARQLSCHYQLPSGQGPRQVISQLSKDKSKLRLAQGKQNLRAACSKGKMDFKIFFEACPGYSSFPSSRKKTKKTF